MAASLSYRPEQYEMAYYLALFRAADVQGRGNIGGAEAVKFFGRSKLSVDVLKSIWTVADTPSTSSLDLKKFAVAVRLIQLTQNGQKGKGQNLETPPGVVLKPVFFEGVSGASVPMPPAPPQQQQQQGGMPPPQPTPQASRPAVPQPTPQQSTRAMPTPSSPSRALVGMDPYTLSPQERQRYESLFPTYAKTEADGSHFVYGSEAVPLFMKSGVDPNKLREIWNMVDRNPVDNRLDKLEFALAMHLIVCVSKKNLPMPTGGALPNSLQALKAAASGAGAAAAPQAEPAQAQMPPPQAEAGMVPPTPGMGASGPPPIIGSSSMGGMNISDAFEGMSAMGSVTDYSQAAPEAPPAPAPVLPSYVPDVAAAPTPAVVPEPPTPQPQPTYMQPPQSPKPVAVESIPAPVAPAPVATYEVSDSHSEELAKLKSVLQKLQAENISLKAQLGNMTDEEKQVQQALGQTVSEITALSSDLGAKRQEVSDAKNRLLEAKAGLKAQQETKEVLTGLISEAKETAEAIESARETLEATTLAQQRAPAPVPEPEPNLFDMGYSNPVTGPPPAAENLPMQQGIEGFSNEAPQPAGEIVTPGTETQGQQQQYANYTAPMAGGYPAPAPVPPQQEMGGYPAPAPVPPQQEMGGYPAPAPMPPQQQAAGGYPAPAPMPPQQQAAGGYPAPAPMPPQQAAGGYPAPAPMPPQQEDYPAPAPVPQQEMGGYPAPAPMPPQQQTPIQQRQAAAPGHVRNASGFDDSFLMGGSAQAVPQDTSRDENVSVAARSIASNGDYGYDDQAFEIVENMKKKAKKADSLARDAEAAHRKLAAEADELRTDADRAEANARSLAAQAAPDEKSKKKGRFGGGGSKKKQKKQKDEADQAAKDAALIKKHFMAIQSQALEAQTVAAQTRSEADRLRDEAEAAELDMAAAASKKQRQPAQAPAPVAPQQAAGGYSNASPVPNYGGMGVPPQQQPYGMPNGGPPMMPPNGGGYNAYTNGMGGDAYGQPQQQAYGAPPQQMSYPPKPEMGNGAAMYGGYGQTAQAPPVAAPGGNPYASPF